jgi:hypothetical protein
MTEHKPASQHGEERDKTQAYSPPETYASEPRWPLQSDKATEKK